MELVSYKFYMKGVMCMFAVVQVWSAALLAKTGDFLIAGYNVLAAVIGK